VQTSAEGAFQFGVSIERVAGVEWRFQR